MESINRPPLKLLFGSPEFILEGIVQATVRVGAKWRDDLAGKGQVVIPCFDAETTERVGQATVVGTLFGSFKDFGYIGSVVNHQEDCRDFDGLIDVLSECYPGFDPDSDQVTVIFFKYNGDAGRQPKIIFDNIVDEGFDKEVYDVKGLTSGLDAKEVTDDEVVTEDSKAS